MLLPVWHHLLKLNTQMSPTIQQLHPEVQTQTHQDTRQECAPQQRAQGPLAIKQHHTSMDSTLW